MKALSKYMQINSFWCPPLRRLWKNEPEDMLKITIVGWVINMVALFILMALLGNNKQDKIVVQGHFLHCPKDCEENHGVKL